VIGRATRAAFTIDHTHLDGKAGAGPCLIPSWLVVVEVLTWPVCSPFGNMSLLPVYYR